MAAEMINEVLKAENNARSAEAAARKKADDMLFLAEKKSRDIYETIVKQGNSEASLIITEAQELTGEIIKQAESIAKLRERKVISEVEKRYPEMISLVLESIGAESDK